MAKDFAFCWPRDPVGSGDTLTGLRITEYTREGGGSLRKGQMFIFVRTFTFYNSTDVTQSGRLNLNKLLPPMRFPIVRHLSFCFAGLSRQRKFVKGKRHQSLLLSLCNWAVWTYHKLGFQDSFINLSTRYEVILHNTSIQVLAKDISYDFWYLYTSLSRLIFWSHKYQMLTADMSDYAVNIGVLDYTAVGSI